jgi:tricorn protease
VPPDVEVLQDPALVAAGHDPQLEKAVELALARLAESPPKYYPRAPYPDRHPLIPDAPMQPGVPLH